MQTARFRAEEIEKAARAVRLRGSGPSKDWAAEGVSIDSRTIRPGELFVALRGKRFDGHDFLEEAFSRGAIGALVEQGPVLPKGKPVWQVPDTLAALGDLAHFHRNRFRLNLIAVTGSSGKTTTKAMIAHLLCEQGEVLSTPGTQNNQIGVPLTLFRLSPSHPAAVLEMGTNQWGEIRRLVHLSQPTMGVVTNVGPAHLQAFGDLQGVLRAKGELWEAISAEAPLVLNADDPLLREAGKRMRRKVVWFGLSGGSDLRASCVEWGIEGCRCRVNERWELEIPLPGLHNLMNALAALGVAQVLGRDLDSAVKRLRLISPLPGRLALMEREGLLWMDDSYNANPASLQAGLEVLQKVKRPGRKVVAVGDMLELGSESERLHAEMGRKIAALSPDLVLAVGPLAARLLSSALENGLPPEAGHLFRMPEEAGDFLLGWVRPGDTILVKGSRAVRMEQIMACFTTSSTR